MRSSTICLFLSCLAASLMAEPQQYHFAYPSFYPSYYSSQQYAAQQPSYFRSGYPYPMRDSEEPAQEGRLFFGTITVTLSTITTTTTATTTTTCTTSTAALTTCSAGRRRRGLFYSDVNKEGRSLFHDDNQEDTQTFLESKK